MKNKAVNKSKKAKKPQRKKGLIETVIPGKKITADKPRTKAQTGKKAIRQAKGKFGAGNGFSKYDETDMKKMYDLYIKHLKAGYSRHSFVPCSHKTVEAHSRNNPADFPIEKIETAIREGQKKWEEIGMNGITGKYGKGFSVAGWIFTLRNRYADTYPDGRSIGDDDRKESNVFLIPSFGGKIMIDNKTENKIVQQVNISAGGNGKGELTTEIVNILDKLKLSGSNGNGNGNGQDKQLKLNP